MRTKILATLLTISLSSSALAQALCQTPLELDARGCRCYAPEQLRKIADGLVELQTCRVDLAAKNQLIEERLKNGPAAAEPAWWQSPTVVVGGVVVSFAVGAGLIYLLKK